MNYFKHFQVIFHFALKITLWGWVLLSSPHYTDGETDDQDYRVKKWQDRDLSPGSLLPCGAFWMTLWLPSKYTQAIKPLVDTTLESPWSPALWSYACSMDLPLSPHPHSMTQHEGKRAEEWRTWLQSWGLKNNGREKRQWQHLSLCVAVFILQGAVIMALVVLLSCKLLPSLILPAKKPPGKRFNFHII